MFNTFNYNTNPYNAPGGLPAEVPASALVFNNYQLQTSSIITQFLIQDNTPNRDFQADSVPRGDGEIITGDFWRRKTIQVRGVIKKSTNTLLEAELDAMKKALAVSEGVMDILIAGEVRRYRATLISGDNMFNERKNYHITFCPFQASFVTVEPFGYSKNYLSYSWFGQTGLTLNEQINNQGTVRGKPSIIMVVTAASGITSVTFKNNTRGEQIKYTGSLSPGDVLKFDSENYQVLKNGTEQDYSGSFPLLDTGANSITIDVAGTSIEYDLTAKYKKPFL